MSKPKKRTKTTKTSVARAVTGDLEITGSQVLKFGVALVAVNVALALVGAWLWPWWWYTEKMATRAPLWLLVLLFGASAVVDAAAGAAMARARVGRRSRSR